MALERKLDFCLKNGINVILSGAHGFGKTAMVKDCFDRAGIKWRYFSAATMDPWVDFVGVPKPVTGPDGVEYLDLIRPKDFAYDNVEAIFFDEFNRAPKKVRNAVMELIQFRSINGHEFKNLKVIWAAINPYDEDETYDVEQLDPAQLDRFQVQINVPGRPDLPWFIKTYGEQAGTVAVKWWGDQDKNVRKLISARRLSDAVKMFNMKGDVRDVIPYKEANVHRLIMELSSGSIAGNFRDIAAQNDADAMRKFLRNDNNYVVAVDYASRENPSLLKLIAANISEERLMTLIVENNQVVPLLLQLDDITPFKNVFGSVLDMEKVDKDIRKQLKQAMYSRFTTAKTEAGVEFLDVPVPNVSPEHFFLELGTLIKDSKVNFAQNDKNNAYKLLNENLSQSLIKTQKEALLVLCICYRIIASSREQTLLFNYGNIFKMVNTCLKTFLDTNGDDTYSSNQQVKALFNQHRSAYAINNLTKVQGFLDLHSDKLIFRARIM